MTAPTNEEFLRAMFERLPDDAAPWVCGFLEDPKSDAARWGGEPARNGALERLTSAQNTYTTVGAYREARREACCAALYALVVDDVGEKGSYTSVNELPLAPSYAVETSPCSFQAVYFIYQEMRIELWKHVQSELAKHGDPSTKNATRYFRLPVGTNSKGKLPQPWAHRVVEWAPDRRYLLESVAEAFGIDHPARTEEKVGQVPPPRPERFTGHSEAEAQQRDSALFSIRLGEGEREDWYRILAAYKAAGGGFETFHAWCATQPGYSSERMIRREWDSFERDGGVQAGTLYHYARQNGWDFPAWPELKIGGKRREEQQTSSDTGDGGASQPGEKPPRALPWITAAEWVKSCQPPQWLIPGIMEKSTLNVLVGGWGAGKSLIGMDQPLRVVHSMLWQGKRAKVDGVWVYVVGEAQRGFQRRLLAWHLRHGLEPTERFIVIPEAVLLGSADANEAMHTALEQIQEQTGQPVIGVTLDTLARCFGLDDENSNSDMGKWLASIQKAIHGPAPDAAVCVIHHPGHGDKGRGRGASALPGAADKEWLIERQASAVVMRCNKSKDDGVPEPMAWVIKGMDLELDGVNVSVPVLDETELPADGENLPPKLQTMLDVLVDMYAQARRNLEAQDRPTYEAKVDRQAWFEQCVTEGVMKEGAKTTFRQYVKRLKEAGTIRTDDAPWVYPVAPR
jgi:hypothetical protein